MTQLKGEFIQGGTMISLQCIAHLFNIGVHG
jgi:hypothetical protein